MDVERGVIGILVTALLGVLGFVFSRSRSKVKTENDADDHTRRFRDSIHRDRDNLAEINRKLQDELLKTQRDLLTAQSDVARLKKRVRDQSIAINNLLDAAPVPAAQARLIQDFVRDSTFAAFDDRPQPPAPKL